MTAILEWQRNLCKELEADNLAAERPPARNDNNYMAKRVVAQALGLPTIDPAGFIRKPCSG